MDHQYIVPTFIGIVTVVGLLSIIISFFEPNEIEDTFISYKRVTNKDNTDKDQDNVLEPSDDILIDNDFYTNEL